MKNLKIRLWTSIAVVVALASLNYKHTAIALPTSAAKPDNQNYHALLDRLQVKNVFNSFSGTHSWRYWRKHLTDSLTFVGEQFSSTTNG